MNATNADILSRQQCTCSDCAIHRRVLTLLDDMATSSADMGCDDIDRLWEARELLAATLGKRHDESTDCYADIVVESDMVTTP